MHQVLQPESARLRLDEMSRVVRHDVFGALRVDRMHASHFELHQHLAFSCLRRGASARYLFPSACLQDAAATSFLRRIAAEGAEVRIAKELESNLLVCDQQTVLLSEHPDAPDRKALLSQEPGLVRNVTGLFGTAWAHATDFTESLPPTPLTPDHRQLLALLLRPGKDVTRARELGVSIRTFHRRVASLYEQLGVASRTEVALVAHEYVGG
ncbi:hypothetical protein [Streptomyces sp. NPDC048565]|uniref:helix-turn-helix transcriptional regulator n=1 Tax=Streptomyces sp. NPDC048565 TaxID=3155266 RepID=UPI0034483BD9